MRVHTVSDLHIDHKENFDWLSSLSTVDYLEDLLIIPGDISHEIRLIELAFEILVRRFAKVLYVPGNHDIWVENNSETSINKFYAIYALTHAYGIETSIYQQPGLRIIPLLGWYDETFGPVNDDLKQIWADFHRCRWPSGTTDKELTRYFLSLNPQQTVDESTLTISCSHFLPRIDVMPEYIPERHRVVYPVLGTARLDQAVRSAGAQIHVYGHSHVNTDVTIRGVRYVNNAFAYPSEHRIARKALLCLHEC